MLFKPSLSSLFSLSAPGSPTPFFLAPHVDTLRLQQRGQQAVSEAGWWGKPEPGSLTSCCPSASGTASKQFSPAAGTGPVSLELTHISASRRVGGCSNCPWEAVSRPGVTGFLPRALGRLSASVYIHFLMDTLEVRGHVAWHLTVKGRPDPATGIRWGDFHYLPQPYR